MSVNDPIYIRVYLYNKIENCILLVVSSSTQLFHIRKYKVVHRGLSFSSRYVSKTKFGFRYKANLQTWNFSQFIFVSVPLGSGLVEIEKHPYRFFVGPIHDHRVNGMVTPPGLNPRQDNKYFAQFRKALHTCRSHS